MRRPWLLLAGAGAVGVAALAGVVVARKRLLTVRVHGTSMLPVYQDGEVLLATRLSPSHDWRQGEDLIFSRTGPVLVPGDPPNLVKRICAVPGQADPSQPGTLVRPDWLVLQGLNNADQDPSYYSVPVNLILAKVVSRLPFRPPS